MSAFDAGKALMRAEDTDIDATAVLVLAAMASFVGDKYKDADGTPLCFASIGSIASRAHVGRSTAIRAMCRLVCAELIDKIEKRGKTMSYRMTVLSKDFAERHTTRSGSQGATNARASGADETHNAHASGVNMNHNAHARSDSSDSDMGQSDTPPVSDRDTRTVSDRDTNVSEYLRSDSGVSTPEEDATRASGASAPPRGTRPNDNDHDLRPPLKTCASCVGLMRVLERDGRHYEIYTDGGVEYERPVTVRGNQFWHQSCGLTNGI